MFINLILQKTFLLEIKLQIYSAAITDQYINNSNFTQKAWCCCISDKHRKNFALQF